MGVDVPADAKFPYTLVWDRFGRKGKKCRVMLYSSRTLAQIQFEDGMTYVIDRMALRLTKASKVETH